MTTRTLLAIGATVAAAAWLTSGALGAQAPKGPAKSAALPRTADGHPDLQGMYDVGTITPLERPAALGTKATFTKEEAAAAEEYERQRQVKNDAPLSGDRAAPPVGGERQTGKSYVEIFEILAGGPVGGYNNFWLSGGTRIVTVDGAKRTSIIVDPPNGRVPPMTAEAAKRNAALRAASVAPAAAEGAAAAGPPSAFDDPELRPLAERCLLGFNSTSGPPSLPNYFYNNLKQIVQTPNSVMILNEMVHDARVVRIGGQHVPSNIRRWMGDSVGRWEGDTLVIDTTNFTDKTQFQGASDQLHVVERIKRVDAQTLLYQFTVDDPHTWEQPWTGEYPWIATDETLYEYACHEGNYALANILRGARFKEKEDAEKAKKP